MTRIPARTIIVHYAWDRRDHAALSAVEFLQRPYWHRRWSHSRIPVKVFTDWAHAIGSQHSQARP